MITTETTTTATTSKSEHNDEMVFMAESRKWHGTLCIKGKSLLKYVHKIRKQENRSWKIEYGKEDKK